MENWQNKPYSIEVKKGQKKGFCSCDLTKTPPFCDGSHKTSGSSKVPYIIKFNQDSTALICGCLQSKVRPYCDGSHKIYNEKNDCPKRKTRKISLCAECIPSNIVFIGESDGNCASCGKETILMEVINSDDEIDDEFYHDIGGES